MTVLDLINKLNALIALKPECANYPVIYCDTRDEGDEFYFHLDQDPVLAKVKDESLNLVELDLIGIYIPIYDKNNHITKEESNCVILIQ